MSTATAAPSLPTEKVHQRYRPVLLVFCCTLIGAIAQILIKMGATDLAHHNAHPGLISAALGMFTDPWLFSGYGCYGLSTVLLVLALREGELSMLYPVIALTYVWVALLSFVVFHEALEPLKLFGIALIVGGVAVLGRKGRN